MKQLKCIFTKDQCELTSCKNCLAKLILNGAYLNFLWQSKTFTFILSYPTQGPWLWAAETQAHCHAAPCQGRTTGRAGGLQALLSPTCNQELVLITPTQKQIWDFQTQDRWTAAAELSSSRKMKRVTKMQKSRQGGRLMGRREQDLRKDSSAATFIFTFTCQLQEQGGGWESRLHIHRKLLPYDRKPRCSFGRLQPTSNCRALIAKYYSAIENAVPHVLWFMCSSTSCQPQKTTHCVTHFVGKVQICKPVLRQGADQWFPCVGPGVTTAGCPSPVGMELPSGWWKGSITERGVHFKQMICAVCELHFSFKTLNPDWAVAQW